MIRRLFLLALVAPLLSVTVLVATPRPVAAACWYGSWITRTKTIQEPPPYDEVRFTSTVRYRVGYSCQSVPQYLDIDTLTIKVEALAVVGDQRLAGIEMERDADVPPVQWYINFGYPGPSCTPNAQGQCSFTKSVDTDTQGTPHPLLDLPYDASTVVVYHCDCGVWGSSGAANVYHQFMAGQIWVRHYGIDGGGTPGEWPWPRRL
jgi:hypothetical protein